MNNTNNAENANKKFGLLAMLEGMMVLCFMSILAAFTIPGTAFSINVIFGGMVFGSICSVALLVVGQKRIGVERGLFKLPVAESTVS